ncbi:hypothetical protein RHSIM_Rhsim06G0171000 [Rhododendron simsii]|uniref:Uncharacterized protein n=1 Tax=Rhododendron simsii TaxID=118357 RepID=A0A834GTK0_RHOSS|nr:hypothetical protein RHSIM_Rhsim06G0171000 [Rhododendron simsii]
MILKFLLLYINDAEVLAFLTVVVMVEPVVIACILQGFLQEEKWRGRCSSLPNQAQSPCKTCLFFNLEYPHQIKRKNQKRVTNLVDQEGFADSAAVGVFSTVDAEGAAGLGMPMRSPNSPKPKPKPRPRMIRVLRLRWWIRRRLSILLCQCCGSSQLRAK